MIDSEVVEEINKGLNELIEKLSEDYSDLIIKIDIVQIKKKRALLKIDIVTKSGKTIIPFNSFYVSSGDTINLTFGDNKLRLRDILNLTSIDLS